MKYWIVSWDNLGIEFFDDITKQYPSNWDRNHLFDSIKTNKKSENPLGFTIQNLTMRARCNTHRHYEIYIFSSRDDVSTDSIQTWFKDDPQGFADWVRENHVHKLFSERVIRKPVIV